MKYINDRWSSEADRDSADFYIKACYRQSLLVIDSPMFHAVIIASLDRPSVLGETLTALRQQTAPPDQIILSVTKQSDLPADMGGATVVKGPAGLTGQRNSGLSVLHPECDLISFFDDDIELAANYCGRMRSVFEHHADLLGCNGNVIADGTGMGGIAREIAREKLVKAALADAAEPIPRIDEIKSMYGCNMNVRRWVMNEVRFDERIAAYGWLEDFDFSSRVAAIGKLGFAPGCRLVHLATTTGRTSGVRMGISQIINPLYLYKKGVSKSFLRMIRESWFRTVSANILGVLVGRHAKYVDRKGRLKGNIIGMWYVARGKIDPAVVQNHR